MDVKYNCDFIIFSGVIPEEIGNLVNLQQLDMSSNEFSGTLPAAIGNMKALRALLIYGNGYALTGKTIFNGILKLKIE